MEREKPLRIVLPYSLLVVSRLCGNDCYLFNTTIIGVSKLMKMRNTKIESAVDPKGMREQLSEPYLDVENKRLVATDGKILTAIKVEVEPDDVSGYISKDALEAARKIARKDREDTIEIRANGSLELKNGDKLNRPDLGTFPDIDNILNMLETDPAKTIRLGINAKLLLDLAKSLANATQVVILDFVIDDNNAVTSAINVSVAKQGSDDKAVIMPVRI